MTLPSQDSLHDLLGKLCDERLERGDIDQLNAMLDSDPIALEECLDQLFISGLLQHEFAGVCPALAFGQREQAAQRNEKNRWSHGGLKLAIVGLLVAGVLGSWWLTAESTPEAKLFLSDSSFEEAASVSFTPTMFGWYGDKAYAVKAAAGVAPLHGDHMLRLVRSAVDPADTCEVYQIVDLRGVARLPHGSPLYVEASAAVNSLPSDALDSYVFAIHLYASPDNPVEQQTMWPASWNSNISFVGKQLKADADHTSWQQISSMIPIQADANYLLIQISVRSEHSRNGRDFPGQFIDNVQVCLKKH